MTMLPSLLLAAAAAAAAIVTPPDAIEAKGIPDVPAALADKVRPYTEARSAFLLDWHPTRRELLIATRFADVTQVHRVAFPLGARTQLTFFPDRVAGAAYRKGSGDAFVFSMDKGGNEFHQTYRYDVATGAVTLLTDGASKNSLGLWSHAGRWLAYTSTRRDGTDTDLYVIDPATPRSDRMLAPVQGGGWSVLDWSPDDRQLLVGEGKSVSESYRYLVDAQSGALRLVTKKPAEGADTIAYGGGQFAPDGRSIYVTTDEGTEFRRLVSLDLATSAIADVTPEASWDVEGFDLTRDGALMAYTTNEDGASVLHLFDMNSGKERPRPSLPAGQVQGVLWHDNGRELGFGLTSARAPSDVYSLDAATGEVTRWTESETGGLNTAAFVEPERIRFKTFDGRELSAYLYLPPAASASHPVPAIIEIHGGPEGQARPGFLGRSNYILNELGVALVMPNVRGSTGYGKTFTKLDNGKRREDSVKDIGALLDALGKRKEIDATRLMVSGGSYGGYMALACATHYSDRLKAAVDVVGISNFVTFLEHTEDYRKDLRRVEYGDERDPAMRVFLESISPLASVAKIKIPMLIVQGLNDPRVPHTEAEQLQAALEANGQPVWYLVAKDEGHGFAKKRNADYQFLVTLRFIERQLLAAAKATP